MKSPNEPVPRSEYADENASGAPKKVARPGGVWGWGGGGGLVI